MKIFLTNSKRPKQYWVIDNFLLGQHMIQKKLFERVWYLVLYRRSFVTGVFVRTVFILSIFLFASFHFYRSPSKKRKPPNLFFKSLKIPDVPMMYQVSRRPFSFCMGIFYICFECFGLHQVEQLAAKSMSFFINRLFLSLEISDGWFDGTSKILDYWRETSKWLLGPSLPRKWYVFSRVHAIFFLHFFMICPCFSMMDGWTNGWTNRWRDGRTDGQTYQFSLSSTWLNPLWGGCPATPSASITNYF